MPLELVYSAPYINWTARADHVKLIPSVSPSKFAVEWPGPPDAEGEKYVHWNLLNPEQNNFMSIKFQFFASGNLSELAGDKEVILMSLNRGASLRLFDNPFHAEQLYSMGLTPDNAFGCAMEFLFHPAPVVMELIEPGLKILRSAISIGIHIRVGDHVFETLDSTVLEDFAGFFSCAQQIQEHFLFSSKRPGSDIQGSAPHDIVWLLMTDSMALRQHARKKYKEVLCLSHAQVQHSYWQQGVNDKVSASLKGFQTAVAEHWLFGLSDAQVVDRHSGFGRSSAMRTYKSGGLFVVDKNKTPHCQSVTGDYITLRDAGLGHSGI